MENFNPEVILEQVLDDLEQERQRARKRSYRTLVPARFQSAVETLVDSNFKNYAAGFGNDRSAFSDQMTRNWLVKHRAFGVIAEKSGMTRVESVDPSRESPRPNVESFAILTQNASYINVGPGAFDRAGGGAPFHYRRIPLRGEEGNTLTGQGFVFSNTPATGKPVRDLLNRTIP